MREIKFRAWCEISGTDKRMYYFFKVGTWVPPHLSVLSWDQFTGLHDINGKEIYEGDILIKALGVGYKSNHYPSFINGTQQVTRVIVEWSPLFRGYPMLTEPADCNFEVTFSVIGNIHENFDLLLDGEHPIYGYESKQED